MYQTPPSHTSFHPLMDHPEPIRNVPVEWSPSFGLPSPGDDEAPPLTIHLVRPSVTDNYGCDAEGYYSTIQDLILNDMLARYYKSASPRKVQSVITVDEHTLINSHHNDDASSVLASNKRTVAELISYLNCSFDTIIHTMTLKNYRVTRALFRALQVAGDVYCRTFDGWFDRELGLFVPTEKAQNSAYKNLRTGTPLRYSRSKAYFFRLKRYRSFSEDFIRLLSISQLKKMQKLHDFTQEQKNIQNLTSCFRCGSVLPTNLSETHDLFHQFADLPINPLYSGDLLIANGTTTTQGVTVPGDQDSVIQPWFTQMCTILSHNMRSGAELDLAELVLQVAKEDHLHITRPATAIYFSLVWPAVMEACNRNFIIKRKGPTLRPLICIPFVPDLTVATATEKGDLDQDAQSMVSSQGSTCDPDINFNSDEMYRSAGHAKTIQRSTKSSDSTQSNPLLDYEAREINEFELLKRGCPTSQALRFHVIHTTNYLIPAYSWSTLIRDVQKSNKLNLADCVGNLYSRVGGIVQKLNNGWVPNVRNINSLRRFGDDMWPHGPRKLMVTCAKSIESLNLRAYCDAIITHARAVNRQLAVTAPWLLKEGPERDDISRIFCEAVFFLSIFLSPICPSATERIHNEMFPNVEGLTISTILTDWGHILPSQGVRVHKLSSPVFVKDATKDEVT